MTAPQAELLEPIVREIIAAFEAPQEGHELAQKLERVWPIIKRALLASVSQPQDELLARARAIRERAWEIAHKRSLSRGIEEHELRRAVDEEIAEWQRELKHYTNKRYSNEALADQIGRKLASPAPQEETPDGHQK